MTERAFLPETPEQLTAAWLSTLFDSQIDSVEQMVLGAGVGFMGDVVRLEVNSESTDVPRYLIAKLPKLENRVVGELLGVYEREIMFFREFGDDLPIRAPQLYFSEFDRDRGSENQKPIIRALDRLPGFMNGLLAWAAMRAAGAKERRYLLLIEYYEDMQPGDQLQGLDAQACCRVLQEVAALHQRYWAQPSLQEHFWLMELDIDARMRQGTLRRHAESYLQRLQPEVAGHIEWLRKHTAELVFAFCAQAPATLLHGDLRLDNFMFSDEGCALLDFQLVRSGPAAYDLAYFLSSALDEHATPEERDQVLRQYHSALAVPDYDYASLRRDYDRAVMIVLATLAGNVDVELGDGRGSAMMEAWMRRLCACVRTIELDSLLDR
jgi:Ser/Thr protein kinase RdoA (MazF antagonist)